MHGRIHLGLGLRIPFLYLLQILTYLPHRVFHVLLVAVKGIVLQLPIDADITFPHLRHNLLLFDPRFLLLLPLLRVPLYFCHLLSM